MVNNYQIREIRGLFYIFVEEETTTGILWWKKRKMEWRRCAANGRGYIYAPEIRIYIPPMLAFITLRAAQEQVEIFKKGTVIHDSE